MWEVRIVAEPIEADQSGVEGGKAFAPSSGSDPVSPTEEFALLQERVEQQVNRIRELEQALDQSLASLDELRSQVVDQHFLERQLASTEEIANVQQQAIYQLKRQFAQQKAELEAKIDQAQQREREYQSLLDAAEAIAQGQQLELERLRSHLGNDATDVSPNPVNSQLHVLQADIQLRRQQLQDLESEKQAAQARITELEAQVETLEGQIARYMTTQALLQQACQELEVDREQSQHRIAELERQAAEMQEQILSQAQQASEYETAVQHWKNRYQSLQDYLSTLKQLLDEKIIELPPEVTEWFATLETTSLPEPNSTYRSTFFNPDLKIDVPDFLMRRRTYRDRNS
jgi:chromosome segregation ATPase